ncbi:MAG TPA: shikimate dehydrogenase [Bacillota bacterium]|nr:shikimate dehydrogenase [Bacillota bacterium]
MANEITSKTSLVALFGDPVEHSISPQIQNQAFKTLQLPLVYLAFRVSKEELPQAVAGAWAMGFMGFNVTIPHKQAMLSLVDELAPSARILGAVNTVRREGKKLIGYNTDGEGFTRAMQEELGITPEGKRFLLLGAGGAARAVALTLAQQGAERIIVANRTVERAQSLAQDIAAIGGDVTAISLEGLPRWTETAQVIINTSPMGMYPNVDQEPLLPEELIHQDHVVCDLIYNPRSTRLLVQAAKKGARTMDGLGMLLWQGALACEIWTGKLPPIAPLEAAASRALAEK